MSNRGRGSGRRGQPYRDQPPPPSFGRGPAARRGHGSTGSGPNPPRPSSGRGPAAQGGYGAARSAPNPPPPGRGPAAQGGHGAARSMPNPPPQQPQPPLPSHSVSPPEFPPLVPAAAPSPWSISQDLQRKLTVASSPSHPAQAALAPISDPAPTVQTAQALARPAQTPAPAHARPAKAAQVQAQSPTLAHPTQAIQAPTSIRAPAHSSANVTAQPELTALQSAPVQIPTSSKALKVAMRPGFGTLGNKCVVKANHFLVKVASRGLHHYDVTITPEVTSKKVCRLIMQELVKCYRESHLGKRQVAYDGVKSMYTAGELPFSVKDFVVKLDNDDYVKRDREFKVSIKFAAKPNLHHLEQFLRGRQSDAPQETIQVLDVVLRSKPSINYTVVGRSFFDKVLGDTGFLGEGLEYCKGFYQSLRPTQMGLSLNIDVSARAFFEPIYVTEFVEKYLNVRNLARPMSEQDRIKIRKALKGIKVVLANREMGRRYKINGFTPQPLRQLKFVDETGSETSVVQYYRDRYDVILNQTALPAIQAGNDSKPVYLPMELCKIVSGQRYTKKLNERQVTALLRATCQRPPDRENSIKRMVRHNNYNNDVVVEDFGIQVNCELAWVDARVLPSPQLQYMDTQENPRVGSWNMMDKRLFNAGRVDFWTSVNFSGLTAQEVENFCNGLVNMCMAKGMYFHPNPILPHLKVPSSQIESALFDIHTQSRANIARVGHAGKQLQLLIVILPGDSDCYGKIKRICETELGIISQCCRPRRDKLSNNQYLENLSLKINVKVGGRNTVLLNAIQNRIPNLTDRPTIIFGADVTHPPPGEDSNPSIAAVVASMDWPEVTKYRGLVSMQPHRDEIIQDLYTCTQDAQKGLVHGGLIREQMIAFRRLTRLKPQRIIFYRDGVSEGQFYQVLLYEMDAIRKACASLEADYMPRVTFVVVQKRHNTRLFAANPGDRYSTDRSGNILPGTVVDTKICHPTDFDFYLCSHAGIQGTSRPAHYRVLFDENDFAADQLQSLTNNLCYTFARCTRAVSIVPPAYYAHLAAFRARYYMEGGVASDSESGTGGGPSNRERVANVRPLPAIKDNVKEVMFYC